MLIADRDAGCRSICSKAFVSLSALVLLAGAGCQANNGCGGLCEPSRTQLYFHAPPGAMVELKAMGENSARLIQPPNAFDDRLERSPEEACIFNLAPGKYEFKYTSVDGIPGASIYGELIVYHANSEEAAIFQRRAFVPISLPSEYYRNVEIKGDEIYPYVGQAYRASIDADDIERLKAGDVVEKVFVVADLEKADKLLLKTDVDIAMAERKIEYAEARFREAYYDFRADVNDPWANFWGTDRTFITWEKKRQEAEQKLDKLTALRKRTKALISADHVLIRQGMLVLATQELVKPYRDVEDAAEKIGEVLLVMRVGGRHMDWGEPPNELAAYRP